MVKVTNPDLVEKDRLPPISFKLRRNMLNNMADSIMAIRDEFGQTLYRKIANQNHDQFCHHGQNNATLSKLAKI